MNTQELIDKHLELVLAHNEVTNITRITSRDEARIKHVDDSLAGLPEIEEAPEGLYADIGSGAGYPGIPLTIASSRNSVLMESVKKKAAILESMAEELGLADKMNVYSGRIEEYPADQPRFSVVTARALTALPSLLELASPLLVQGGHLVCYKADDCAEELKDAIAIQDKLGMQYLNEREYELGDNEIIRRLIVFRKVGEPKVKLPRRAGMAQKRPYKA